MTYLILEKFDIFCCKTSMKLMLKGTVQKLTV